MKLICYLGTEMKVAEEDGGLGAGDDQNDEHEEEEPVHVVDLTGPDAVQDEEQLDKDAAEGEDSTHDDAGDGLGVDGLVWNLSGNLVGSHWLLNPWFSESKVGSNKGERNGDSEPESEERDQSEEWDSSRGSLVPEDEVEDEEVTEHNARTQHRGEQDVALPLLSSE